MANAEQGAEGQQMDLTPDHITERLVSDPSQPADATVLSGFLGRSSREGHERLYLDLELRSYVEVPRDAILHRERVGSEDSPMGQGTRLWVRSGTRLTHQVAQPQMVQAEFLSGPLTQHLTGAHPLMAAMYVAGSGTWWFFILPD
jgi:hypothetical protein